MRKQFTPPLSHYTTRVLHIRDNDIGTGFFLEVENRQYFITAAHLVGEQSASLHILEFGTWKRFPCDILARDTDVDVAIIRLPFLLRADNGVARLSIDGLKFGQHVWFLGFPYGFSFSVDFHHEGRFPHPFVKWGAISGEFSSGKRGQLAIDATNNPGFSGGPIGFTDETGNTKILGMVTGFREEEQFIYHAGEPCRDLNFSYRTNTGLMHATKENAIADLIRSNPDGTPIE